MSTAIDNLHAAIANGMSTRPCVGGFPHLAEALRRVRYDVDFIARTVAYYGVAGESYVEDYPAVPQP